MGAGTQDGDERRGTSSPFLPGLRTEGASEGTQHTCLTNTSCCFVRLSFSVPEPQPQERGK